MKCDDGERELLDRAVKALEAELATKTCNNKQVIIKLVASEDAISRQAAIEEIRFGQSFITKIHPTGEIEHLFDKENKALEAAVERIEALPSVTPKQRTGHWIETAEEYYKAVNEYGGGVNEDTPYFVDDIACSECLSMFSVIDNETERFDCCPHCGAKMVETQESEEQS